MTGNTAIKPTVLARVNVDKRTGVKRLNPDSHKTNLYERYILIVVREKTLPIMEQFQTAGVLVMQEGDPIYSKKFSRIFSAVPPKEKLRIWWQEVLSRSDDPNVNWMW